MAAMPRIRSAETRMPAIMTGQASGISILKSCCQSLNPIPLADSVIAGSTDCRPVMVFLRIERTA